MPSKKINQKNITLQFKDPPPEYGIYPNWWWEGSKVNNPNFPVAVVVVVGGKERFER